MLIIQIRLAYFQNYISLDKRFETLRNKVQKSILKWKNLFYTVNKTVKKIDSNNVGI